MPLVSLSMKALTWLSGTRAHKTVGGLAVDEGDHGRDRLDAHLTRDLRMLVDVHLDQLDLALGGADCLFDDRRQLTAGADQGAQKSISTGWRFDSSNDVLHEGLGGGFLDQNRVLPAAPGRRPAHNRHGILA